MICCAECFLDPELKAAITMIGHKGNCPVCNRIDVWIYDSDIDKDNSNVEELLDTILELYVPESELKDIYPETERLSLAERLKKDWNIFSGSISQISRIVEGVIEDSFDLSNKLIREKVGIPQLFDESYLKDNSMMGKYNWEDFKKYLRNENRFHSKYINLEVLAEILKDTVITIPQNEKFYRGRISDKNGFAAKDMGAPPDDVATAGRANSKGQSCLYLSNRKKTTVKEIRAHVFDYVTIATFRLNRDIQVLDLSSITHASPFYTGKDMLSYLVNERYLREIENDLAKPLSRWDSELDYLPTQYISDFAKFLGYDGVKYFSTFDKDSYNLALFEPSACDCIYHRNFLIGNLDYKMSAV